MSDFKEDKLLYRDEVYAIQGAVFEVYRELGCGFLEQVYQESLELELASRGIPYLPQASLALTYKSSLLKQAYIGASFAMTLSSWS